MTRIRLPRKSGPKQISQLSVLNPGKGLNNFVSDSLIQDTESSSLLNIQFSESGCPTKSYGTTAVGTGLSSAPKGLGVLITSSVRRLLTIDGTSLKYLNSSTWTAISGASFTAGQEVNFVQARDVVYIWNGQEAGAQYDGTTLSRPTTTVSAQFGIFYNGRQIVSGVTSLPNRLYISNSTDASDFTNTNPTGTGEYSVYDGTTHPGATAFAGTGAAYLDVAKGDGDKITGFAKFQEQLIIFKERSIYSMTFDSSGTPVISQVTAAMGAVSHKSIENIDNDVFFLSRNGYYVLGNEANYNTAIRTNELSTRIKPLIETISASNLSKAASIYSDFRFYSSVSTGGTSTNNKTITYDKRYQAWSQLDYIKANAFTEYIDSNNTKHLYYASADEAQVYEIAVGYSANGTAINAQWTSKAFDAGSFDGYKRWLDVTLLFRQIIGTVTIKIYSDNNELIKTSSISSTTSSAGSMGTETLGSQILGGTGDTPSGTSTNNIPKRVKINTKSRTLKIMVSNNNNNESFTLLGINIAYVPYSRYSFPSSDKIY